MVMSEEMVFTIIMASGVVSILGYAAGMLLMLYAINKKWL